MSRSIPRRGQQFARVDPAESRLPVLTSRGRDLISADYVRLLGELWELERLLVDATAVGEKASPGIVELGDLVTIEFSPGHGLRRRRTVEQYLLVHPVEAPLGQLRISAESPLARAVLGQPIGARVDVHAPAGRYGVRILATEAAPDGH